MAPARVIRIDSKSSVNLFAGETDDGRLVDLRLCIGYADWWENPELADEFLASLIDLLDSDFGSRIQEATINSTVLTSNHMSASKLEGLYDVFGRLNVKGITFVRNHNEQDSSRSLYNLSHFIRKTSKGLKKLRFYHITFDGSTHDFHEFGSALSECTAVTTLLDFDGCSVANGKGRLENVHPVLSAIDSIPFSEYLDLECWIPTGWNGSPASTNALLPLAQLTAFLQELTISQEQLSVVSAAIQHSHASPKSLTLHAKLNQEDIQHVADIVTHCSESLKAITLVAGSPHQDDRFLAPLVTALGGNSTLKRMIFRFGRFAGAHHTVPFGQELLQSFADTLETCNWTLTKLEFLGRYQWNARSRIVLVTLSMPALIEKRLKYNLKLNWLGRSKVLKQDPKLITREDWIWRLHRSRKDINCLFFFLSMNPFMCDECGDTHLKLKDDDEGGIATRTRKRKISQA